MTDPAILETLGPRPDHRVAAFCSPDATRALPRLRLSQRIWKDDPFDVETIHAGPGATFQRLVEPGRRATGLPAGRILLLLGEAGAARPT